VGLSISEEAGEDPIGVGEFDPDLELGLFFGVAGVAVRCRQQSAVLQYLEYVETHEMGSEEGEHSLFFRL